MPYNDLTGEMTDEQHSLATSSEANRRTRMLYSNPEDARRNIMRIPGVASHYNRTTMSDAESSGSPSSVRSDPFDLRNSTHVENLPGQSVDGNQDSNLVNDYESRSFVGDFTVYDEGADAEAYVPLSSRSSPFRLMNLFTKCFIQQDHSERYHHRKHPRGIPR